MLHFWIRVCIVCSLHNFLVERQMSVLKRTYIVRVDRSFEFICELGVPIPTYILFVGYLVLAITTKSRILLF